MPSFSFMTVDNLPDEILAEIFLLIPHHRWRTTPDHSTPEEHLRYPRPTYRKRLPWVLTHVCRKWREIAHSTVRLWSYLPSIDISLPNPYLREYLSLSGTKTPLSLHICMEHTKSKFTNDTLSLLLGSVERWQEVMIFLPYAKLPDLQPLRGSFRMLRVVHVIHRHDWGGNFPLDLFSDAPVLEELTYLILGSHPILPPSLKKYQAYYRGPIDAIDILSRASQLETLGFSTSPFSSPSAHNQSHLPPTEMPFLESLMFDDCWDDPGGPFLRALTLPKLRNLHLKLTATTGNFRYPDIIQMIQQSGASLRSLTVEAHIEAYPTLAQFKELFATTPGVEIFRWYSRPAQRSENDLLAILRDPEILPNLKTLIFDSWMFPAYSFDQSLLLDIIRVRGASREASQAKGHLTYLCLRKSDVSEDDQVSLTGWSPHNDPHYDRLVNLKDHLQRLFKIPVHDRQIEDTDAINHHLTYLTDSEESQSCSIEAILISEIHILLTQLVLRGPAHPPGAHRVESDWIPRVELILQTWRSRTREYVQPSLWFRFHWSFYWVAENQPDVYGMFWETELSPESSFHFRGRSMPMTFLNPTIPYNWMPDWELAELPYKAYQPPPRIEEIGDENEDLLNDQVIANS
ncbi:hypothetical protein BDN72DRAFT_964647 [Pluteus cervinus]|uniref:Uncharacterized protein n=1 Tax=Pluteus cervinus TaxID=181527 RepID=A0ACD3A995_9AGAR|nr:hypothetical protein BDN72DRAFT_964647 [Pluteus cervinus]